ISVSFRVSGYVEAEAMVPVVPFVQGTIVEYNAKAGKKVYKDDVLAVIDPEPYVLQAKQAEAAYLAYDATFERVASLYEKGGATQQNYDEVKAQRDAAKAQLDLAHLQLSYAYVTAPVDGTILMADQAVGSIGVSSQPVAVIADLDNLIMNINVPEKYFSDVTKNLSSLKISITRTVGDVSDTAEGSIVSVSPYIDPTTKTFALRVKLSSNIEAFRPGMYVTADIVYSEKTTLTLPQKARKLDGSVYFVRKDSEGVTRAQYADFSSQLSDNNYFEDPSEYEGVDFIVRGQNNVLSGMPVRIVEGF
ncbi:MAG: efflux RND transporter periplasmic adaptor subunit, partial [Spirochaetales bacterium]|nr:efflux RND transporter periplasmic adaptor subunit [Candidatus Physcosoma equi]